MSYKVPQRTPVTQSAMCSSTHFTGFSPFHLTFSSSSAVLPGITSQVNYSCLSLPWKGTWTKTEEKSVFHNATLVHICLSCSGLYWELQWTRWRESLQTGPYGLWGINLHPYLCSSTSSNIEFCSHYSIKWLWNSLMESWILLSMSQQ